MQAMVLEPLVPDLPVIRARHAAPDGPDTAARDMRTLRRLLAVLQPTDTVVVSEYLHRWWDGAAHSPCLRARVAGRRVRVVETAGRAVVLPAAGWRARRALRRIRAEASGAPLTPHPMVPQQAGPAFIEQEPDALRCGQRGCGGLLVVGAPGEDRLDAVCPRCRR
jgi:hypothetical protein